MFELIKELSETCGISGDEGAVRTLISEKMRPLCEKIETDRMGNLICYKRGRDSSKRVLVDAHMDEVGLLISYITED